jgi:hypothetical protein
VSCPRGSVQGRDTSEYRGGQSQRAKVKAGFQGSKSSGWLPGAKGLQPEEEVGSPRKRRRASELGRGAVTKLDCKV